MERNKYVQEQEDGVYYAPLEKSADRILTPLNHFIRKEKTSSLFLIAAAVLALFLANSPFSGFYHDITHMKLGFTLGSIKIENTLLHWINDGLMALFFFVIGLELKHEILVGELASARRAVLPLIAAIGGMVVPALIYYIINPSGTAARGWAIPMATDIAFALGIMALLGNKVPRALITFLAGLAIADDLGTVLIIAIFYAKALALPALIAAAGCTGILTVLNFSGIRWPIPYFIVAVSLWIAMFFSGIHPTLAGIIGAFTVPARPKLDPDYFRDHIEGLLDRFSKSYRIDGEIITNETMKSLTERMEEMLHSVTTPSQRLYRIWLLPVAFVVLPVFALFNAGVPLSLQSLTELAHSSVVLGITFGLVFGKFFGITGACWLALKLKLAQLPDNTSLSQIAGAALLAGIGFTMSIFIAQLEFEENPDILIVAKTGVLLASLISGTGGYYWLWLVGRNNRL